MVRHIRFRSHKLPSPVGFTVRASPRKEGPWTICAAPMLIHGGALRRRM